MTSWLDLAILPAILWAAVTWLALRARRAFT